MSTSVISEEIAIEEIVNFYNEFGLEKKEWNEVKEELNIAMVAVKQGLLVFIEGKPVFQLQNPIQNKEKTETVLEKIEFKTRILPRDHVNLGKGLNIAKEQMQFSLNCTAFLACLPSQSYLNKFSKFDYTVIQQITNVFI